MGRWEKVIGAKKKVFGSELNYGVGFGKDWGERWTINMRQGASEIFSRNSVFLWNLNRRLAWDPRILSRKPKISITVLPILTTLPFPLLLLLTNNLSLKSYIYYIYITVLVPPESCMCYQGTLLLDFSKDETF